MRNFIFFFLKRAPPPKKKKIEPASGPTQSGSAPGQRNVEWGANCDNRGYVNHVCIVKPHGILKVKITTLKSVYYVRKDAIGSLAIVSTQDRFN
jgi:hypothetical protein